MSVCQKNHAGSEMFFYGFFVLHLEFGILNIPQNSDV